jgi:IclR family pca regulon transcriptional regulator
MNVELDMKNPRADGEYINSLAKGLSVLRSFTREKPELTLSEVAALTGLSPAAARRCLNTLVHLDYVGRRGKFFLLKPEVIVFASAFLESMNLEEIVQPHLQQVRDKTGDSSSLAVLFHENILYLVHVSTNRMVRLAAGVGTQFPIYATSLGRIMLAYQHRDMIEGYLHNVKMKAFTDKTVVTLSKFRSILKKAKRDSYASVQDELDYGIVSVAVPVFNDRSEVVAAINCSTSTARIKQDEMIRTRLPVLREAADHIEMELRRYPMLAYSVGLNNQ